ncbi:MAG: sulfite exporter TauE/SafE family protein [Candidatus Eremiobacteraeota bacterium]|nr:sulfite exporter TauE/SafE family protein [Candidatus Eremiobacteraeota bacterium]
MTAVVPLLLYGLAVGISLGLTGGGGSIIAVPLLVYLVGQPVHVAIPTSFVIVGGTAFAGYLGRMSAADTRAGLILGVVGLVGAIGGRFVAQFFSGRMLLLLFALIMIVASYFMFRSKTYEAQERAAPNWAAVTLSGVGLGFLTGFLGVGGGFLIVPCLVLILGMPMRQAIPTSLLVIAINCASSLLGHFLVAGHAVRTVPTIDWPVAGLFLIGGLAGSWIGGSVARKLNQRVLKRVFAVFVFAVGLFIAASTTGLIPVSVK